MRENLRSKVNEILNGGSDKMNHIAVFKGNINRVIYVFDNPFLYGTPFIHKKKEVVRHETIEEVGLDKPLMKEGEEVYLVSIDKIAKINKIVRSTDGKVIYFTNYEIELIEDEETEKSKQESESYEKNYYKNLQNENQVKNEKFKKKWYEFWW